MLLPILGTLLNSRSGSHKAIEEGDDSAMRIWFREAAFVARLPMLHEKFEPGSLRSHFSALLPLLPCTRQSISPVAYSSILRYLFVLN